MTIAVLALQGAFVEHEAMLERLVVEYFEIRQRRDLKRPFEGLILPGGESTVMGKLLRELDLFEPLKKRIEEGLPVFGTCAGLILLAEQVDGGTPCFETMDIKVKRNAYGRQLGSFRAEETFAGLGHIPMTFIRAPYIESIGTKANILATVGSHIVAAQQGNQVVTAFHPELCEDLSVHRYFLNSVC